MWVEFNFDHGNSCVLFNAWVGFIFYCGGNTLKYLYERRGLFITFFYQLQLKDFFQRNTYFGERDITLLVLLTDFKNRKRDM